MSVKRRMDAYYYGFRETGCSGVDLVLSAVASAGKGFHQTEDWNEEWEAKNYGSEFEGRTPAETIQKAAYKAAEDYAALEARVFEMQSAAIDLAMKNRALEAKAARLADGLDAYKALGVCYRIGKTPSEKLFKSLKDADSTLAEWRNPSPASQEEA